MALTIELPSNMQQVHAMIIQRWANVRFYFTLTKLELVRILAPEGTLELCYEPFMLPDVACRVHAFHRAKVSRQSN